MAPEHRNYEDGYGGGTGFAPITLSGLARNVLTTTRDINEFVTCGVDSDFVSESGWASIMLQELKMNKQVVKDFSEVSGNEIYEEHLANLRNSMFVAEGRLRTKYGGVLL